MGTRYAVILDGLEMSTEPRRRSRLGIPRPKSQVGILPNAPVFRTNKLADNLTSGPTVPQEIEYIAFWTKDPTEILDYELDWGDYFNQIPNDRIVGVSFLADDGIVVEFAQFTPVTSTLWISGGSPNEQYDVAYILTTAEGRQIKRTVSITTLPK